MSFRDNRTCNVVLQRRGEIQESEGIGHSGTVAPYPAGDFFLGQMKFFNKTGVGASLFNGIQILTLDIFNQGQLQGFVITAGLHDNHRYFFLADQTSCSEPPLPGNQCISIAAVAADQKRLDNSFFTNRLRQLPQFFLVETGSRLMRINLYLIYITKEKLRLFAE
ncbi:MAG: hypothetical protein D3906_11015 [Candidatus Electrothrix sp. AUS1_2]|nr:hypothetical protein [Candidatus Electrothrix sp. AUS1_2]